MSERHKQTRFVRFVGSRRASGELDAGDLEKISTDQSGGGGDKVSGGGGPAVKWGGGGDIGAAAAERTTAASTGAAGGETTGAVSARALQRRTAKSQPTRRLALAALKHSSFLLLTWQ